jgi:RNA polymerase sigma-70 factor (ECF subfamily)
MSHDTTQSSQAADQVGLFPHTHWSRVIAAGKSADSTHAREALARLCETYWYPLYAFIRRQGHAPHDAEDLTQSFFAFLLERNLLAVADPSKGRFRSFLLVSLKNFLANEFDRAQAQKRGGGQVILSFNANSAETRFVAEPADYQSPDKVFERNWALALLAQVLARLRAEQVAEGKLAQFDKLKPFLMGDGAVPSYAELAAQTGLKEETLRMAVSRLRRKFRILLCEEIAHTLADPSALEDELRCLFAALGG